MVRRGVAIVLGLALLPGCGTSTSQTFTVRGELDLVGESSSAWLNDAQTGGACYSASGYEDVAQGVAVTIRNGQGDKVALGRLSGGTTADVSKTPRVCVFRFKIAGVPLGSEVYSVEVSHRGEIDFKRADAGSLALTLGS